MLRVQVVPIRPISGSIVEKKKINGEGKFVEIFLRTAFS